MKDFFETWKFKILIGIAVFLVGIMAYAGANDRLTAAPQELLSVAVAPFQKAAAMVGDRVASLWENYTNIGAILDENEQLTAENAELRKQMVDYDRLKAENEAYKALANIQNTRPEMSCVSAFVIGRDPLDAFYGFTLDQGSVDGVELNDTVVSDEGYLLGVVVEVEATSCKVMTILHPNFNAAGVVSRTRDNGIITGSSDYAADGLCVLTNLNRNTLTQKSDQVITTGLGGVFPADVLVGVVREVVPEVSGKSSIAVIAPGADHGQQHEVGGGVLQIKLHDHRHAEAEDHQLQRQHPHGAAGGVVPHQAADGTEDAPRELALLHRDGQRQRQQPEGLCLPQPEQPRQGLQDRAQQHQQRIADPFGDLAALALAA